MAKKKKQQNISGIIITVLAVLLAAASVIFLFITISNREKEEQEQATSTTTTTPDPGFVADEEFISTIEQTAYELLEKNYYVYRYLTYGMEVEEEPYGNLPEDGFYTCVTDEFADFAAFSEYVSSIYVKETAEKLLTDPFGNGPVFGEDEEGLGLSVDFTPSEEEMPSWNIEFVCTPLSEDECDLEVTIKGEDGNNVKKKLKLLLEEGSWKLSEMVI